MAQSSSKRKSSKKSNTQRANAFQLSDDNKVTQVEESAVHLLGPGIRCDTDNRGYATPRNRTPAEIVVDASEGFIPLWDVDMTLRWRFRESSMQVFVNPTAAKAAIRQLFGEALLAWGTAAPIAFAEDNDVWDFEIVMRAADDCNASGCVLASAFFPDQGRHDLVLYPKMFEQSRNEQIDTLIHEIGHVYGLRHFFAQVSEAAWPSEVFGTHSKFSIMNYGELSDLTAEDKNDLRRLYQLVWAGSLTHINGTPIHLMRPFHTTRNEPESRIAVGQDPFALRNRTLMPPQSIYQTRTGATYLD